MAWQRACAKVRCGGLCTVGRLTHGAAENPAGKAQYRGTVYRPTVRGSRRQLGGRTLRSCWAMVPERPANPESRGARNWLVLCSSDEYSPPVDRILCSQLEGTLFLRHSFRRRVVTSVAQISCAPLGGRSFFGQNIQWWVVTRVTQMVPDVCKPSTTGGEGCSEGQEHT